MCLTNDSTLMFTHLKHYVGVSRPAGRGYIYTHQNYLLFLYTCFAFTVKMVNYANDVMRIKYGEPVLTVVFIIYSDWMFCPSELTVERHFKQVLSASAINVRKRRQNILALTQGLWNEVAKFFFCFTVGVCLSHLKKVWGEIPQRCTLTRRHVASASRELESTCEIIGSSQKGTRSIAINNAFTHRPWIMNVFMRPKCGMWRNIASPKMYFDWSISFSYISILYGEGESLLMDFCALTS